MKKKILKISFSQLLKLEFQYLASSVIEIVEKHDPEALKIKEIFDILVKQKPQIKLLKVRYGPHPITLKLSNLRFSRNAYAQGMIDQLKTLERVKESGTEEALIVAKPIVIRYLQNLSKNTEKTIRQTLIQFFDVVAEDGAFQMALETLGLLSYHDNLQSVNTAIDEQYILRRENVSARPKDKTPDIIAAIMSDTQDLFKQIEVAQIKHPEIDYTTLIDELNNEIAKAKAEVKARKSINKKKAEEKALNDNEIVIEGDSEEPLETSQPAQRMYPMNAQVDDEGDFEQVDKKRTVAVPRKQLLLPDVSTEA